MLIFRADIVLEGIAANISALLDAWWENPNIVECLQRLDRVRHLYWDNVQSIILFRPAHFRPFGFQIGVPL
jgi:hypothetical protein